MNRPPKAVALSVVLVSVVALLLMAGSPGVSTPSPGLALPCPGSTNLLGLVTVNVDCTIGANTVWGNGTLLMGGNLTVDSGFGLTLENVTLRFTPAFDEEFELRLDGGRFYAVGGALTSSNPGDHWRLETTTTAGALVSLEGTSVSYAGGASVSGFLLRAGTGHRFERVSVNASAVGGNSTTAVIRLAGPAVNDVRVENGTFAGSGCAFEVDGLVQGTNLVFAHNRITGFSGDPSAAAVFGGNAEILDNVVDAGTATGIEAWGGGPGWPATNAFDIAGNTVTTTGDAIATSGSNGYDILRNTIVGGHVALDGSGNRFAFNNITGTDARASRGHIVWTSANSSFDNNTLWNVDLTTDSGFLVLNYGNVRVADNRLYLGCYGNNCMAIETINVEAVQHAIYPGFPTVEVARNRITWMAIASNGVTIMLDNEFSEREWLHDNVEVVADPTGRATSSLQGGGVIDSVYENNTILGPTTWCIYDYIDSSAGNLFQNNRCNDAQYGGIFQTGGNVYRSNAFTNLTTAGIWICPNAPCAGSTDLTTSNAWYNNSFTYASSTGGYLTQMTLSNALNNSFVGHGASQWTDGTNAYPVFGDWLFFANETITHLAYSDGPGTRTLTMVSGGRTYWDREAAPGVADSASLSIDGAMDPSGSLNGGTVLWSLNPNGSTGIDVTGQGAATFTFHNFRANSTYAVAFRNKRTSSLANYVLTTDRNGDASLPANLGGTSTPYTVLIQSGLPPPGGDTIPPAATTDLRVFETGADYAILQWTAPGDNGMLGQASEYDLRWNATAPITDANFNESTYVVMPPPGLPGTTISFNVTGLDPETQYWFALKTADGVPNWSPLSNVATATTSPPGSGSSSPPVPAPSVVSATFLPQAGALDLVFSQPMDRISVNTSIRIAPSLEYRVDWINDTHLRLTFLEPLAPGTTYVLTVTRTAMDTEGYALGASFTYSFPGSPSAPGNPPPLPWRLFRGPGMGAPLTTIAFAAAVLLAALGGAASPATRKREGQRRERRGRHGRRRRAKRRGRKAGPSSSPELPRGRRDPPLPRVPIRRV